MLAWAGTVLPALAISGTVVDRRQSPIEGARVCYLSADVEVFCAGTDSAGFYELPDSELDRIRLSAPGYLPRVLAAVEHEAPIVLQRAATLLVRLEDAATAERLSGGEVHVTTPSGRRLGPFPVSAAGVRVRSLEPGTIRITASAEGYEQAGDRSAELVAGEETAVTVGMRQVEQAPAKPSGGGT